MLELAVPASAGWEGGRLEWKGTVLTPSTWPNTGLGYVRRVNDAGAVYAQGRTLGPKPHCTCRFGSHRSFDSSFGGWLEPTVSLDTAKDQSKSEERCGFGWVSIF